MTDDVVTDPAEAGASGEGKRKRFVLVFLLHLAALLFLGNASFLAHREDRQPILLAHRGIAQRFDTRGLKADTCTAARMLPPVHGYLENTIPSMLAAFVAGADVVELDVHPTTDGEFAVFHDWTLDCRTEGHGVTREHSMAELKALDVGYGYTADGGKTFPFRGQGRGLMPSLGEVLAAFPEGNFLINLKSRDASEGRRLVEFLQRYPQDRRPRLMVYGAEEPIAEVRRLRPKVRTLTKERLKTCLKGYTALGWYDHVPAECEDTLVVVPINVAPWLWGWPNRFLKRMEANGSLVFVAGPYHGDGFSTGIDTRQDLARLPKNYSGGIWTNEIETIAKALGRTR